MITKTTLEANSVLVRFIVDGYNGTRPKKDDWFNALNAAMRVQNDLQNAIVETDEN